MSSLEGDNTIRIGPSPRGRGFRLEAAQFLPRPREQVFEFFADAFQLQNLTPPLLHFSVLTPAPIRIQTGTIIDYRLRLRGIPLKWRSCISQWTPPERFVDEQLRGPYRWWHHEHRFDIAPGGTLCRDVVDYGVLGGWLIHQLLVRRDLVKIFEFRHARLRELFA